MTGTPPRRKNRTVFWITTILVAFAVAATVLLANDMRNLRLIAERYHLNWFDHKQEIAPKIVAAKPRTKLNRVEARVPNRFFKEPSNAPGTFVRTWRISGETLCTKLAEAGVPVGNWQPTAPGAGTFECTNAPIDATDDASDVASFVVTVRGTTSSAVSDIRMKVVIPFTPAGMAVRDKFLTVVTMLIEQSGWLDYKNSFGSVSRLENVAQPAFGAKLTFFHEYNNIRHCTLLLELQNQTPEQRLASAYFEKARWLPLPPPGLTQ
ncbi:DUF6030 family protein [Rhizobium tubonense]|uniref:Exopolysaccharide biosynthesis protein n=1 Tax=Rhizobium tubonense TaxID=484088 RepID=A0A2W4DWX6_9HYPH|nr:DUF6030 family protein [Rhizobium tubonense]PZM08436.1 hypothetical protein CPY51_28625 [Rhizobium tubonense]